MSLFAKRDRIFQSEKPFREEYVPKTLRERDEEIEEYADALYPITNGDPPKNIFVYGKAGVGKTVVTGHVLDELQSEVADRDDVNLTTITLSCRQHSSSYQVALHLVNELRKLQNKSSISTTGYPRREAFEMMFEEFDRIGGTILIVLDEIDGIKDDDLFYEIPRAVSNGNVSDSSPAIIGISNDFKFKDSLSPEARDSLCGEEINFPPYNSDELTSILKRRADEGFANGVYSSGVIRLAAALAGKDTGSARQGLRLLHKAGSIARRTEETEITTENVKEAEYALEEKKMIDGIRDLTTHAHLILGSIIQMQIEGVESVRKTTIAEKYTIIADRAGESCLSERRMYDHLQELVRYGFLDAAMKNTGQRDGRFREFSLDVPLETVLNALKETDLSMLAESFEDRAIKKGLIN